MLRKVILPMLATLAMTISAWGGDEPARVQMLSMMVPTIDKAGQKMPSTPLTIILESMERKAVTEACKHSIYMRDAMLESLYMKPVVRKANGDIDVDGAKVLVIDTANRVLGYKGITEAWLIDSAKGLGGGASGKLPFSSVFGCKDLDGKGKKPKEANGDGKDGKKDAKKGH